MIFGGSLGHFGGYFALSPRVFFSLYPNFMSGFPSSVNTKNSNMIKNFNSLYISCDMTLTVFLKVKVSRHKHLHVCSSAPSP